MEKARELSVPKYSSSSNLDFEWGHSTLLSPLPSLNISEFTTPLVLRTRLVIVGYLMELRVRLGSTNIRGFLWTVP